MFLNVVVDIVVVKVIRNVTASVTVIHLLCVVIYSRRHESANGFYCVSVYFFSKIFCDFIPLRFVPLCPLSVISYFMIGSFSH